jgi:hypothetical protein
MSGYPANIGQNSYALLRGLAESIAVDGAQLDAVHGAMRLPSSQGASIDSFAYDFFAGTFYRFAQYGETDAQWISRIESIFSIPKTTIPGLQAILLVFWPWIKLQFGVQNLFVDTGIGGVDSSGGVDVASSGGTTSAGITPGQAMGTDVIGGADTGTSFIDAPAGLQGAPIPIVFDAQSSPTLSALITPHIVPPYFCVYLQYPGYSDTLIHPILSPSLILTQLINSWRAVGTQTVYAQNKP